MEKDEKKLLSVVVSVYNEELVLGDFYMETKQILESIAWDYELIFVNDGSQDTSLLKLEELVKRDVHVRLVNFSRNFGHEAAMIAGIDYSRGDGVICMDADLQHPPIVLKYMYKAMESGADFCIPSRLIPGGDDGGLNWYRKFVSWTARKIGQVMLPCLRKITDPTSGLFMFRKEVIEHADLQPIGWKIMVEVLAMGTYKKVIEIPYKFQQRTEGESKLSGRVTMEYLKQLMNLRKRYNKSNTYTVETWSVKKMKG